MNISIPLADSTPLEFTWPDDLPLLDVSRPRLPANKHWRAEFTQRLREPIGYPPLAQAVFPGDRVAIPLDVGIPRASEIVRLLVSELLQGGVQPDDITVLVASGIAARERFGNEEDEALKSVRFLAHDAEEPKALAYLAADRQGRPVYLHHCLCEADVVLPIGLACGEGQLRDMGPHASWFPRFSNAETAKRFAWNKKLTWAQYLDQSRAEITEAAWLLGAPCGVQVVPGPAGQPLGVWFGEIEQIARLARGEYHQAWLWQRELEPEIAIAVVDTPATSQTWFTVAQAARTAASIVKPGGNILIWTHLAMPPSHVLANLGNSDDMSQGFDAESGSGDWQDALAARVLGECLETHHLFLKADLNNELIEDMGLGACQSVAELQHLLQAAASCAVLGSAAYLVWE